MLFDKNCMDPNAMSFSWIPSKKMKETELKNRVKEEASMDLQVCVCVRACVSNVGVFLQPITWQ